jgi:hypothetical protein
MNILDLLYDLNDYAYEYVLYLDRQVTKLTSHVKPIILIKIKQKQLITIIKNEYVEEGARCYCREHRKKIDPKDFPKYKKDGWFIEFTFELPTSLKNRIHNRRLLLETPPKNILVEPVKNIRC